MVEHADVEKNTAYCAKSICFMLLPSVHEADHGLVLLMTRFTPVRQDAYGRLIL